MRDIEQGLRFASPPAYVLGHAYGVVPYKYNLQLFDLILCQARCLHDGFHIDTQGF